jgi:hypothetical protein
MTIEKLTEFAKTGQKNTDDLDLETGFIVNRKPARQWFNWLFSTLTTKINEIIDADFMPKSDVIDNLTTDDATKPVSAKQARLLQDNKLGKNENAASATNCGRSVVAGNGLSGGGELNVNRTVTLGTPSTVTASTTNSTTSTSHTHNLDVNSLPLLGVGQTWQDVTSSRSFGITYTNNTGRPIQVAVTSGGGSSGFRAYINGIEIIRNYSNYNASSPQHGITLIIPNGSTYSFTGGQLQIWAELR